MKTMYVSDISLFQILKDKIGEDQAKTLVEYIDTKVDTKVEKAVDEKTDVLATKQDLAETKADIIKWMFIFWVGLLGAVIAITKLL